MYFLRNLFGTWATVVEPFARAPSPSLRELVVRPMREIAGFYAFFALDCGNTDEVEIGTCIALYGPQVSC